MLILASKSPRRKELLSIITKDFTIIPAVGEENADKKLPPKEYVSKLAEDKADEVFALHKEAAVIGADTVVAAGKEILGKPKDKADAFRMLKLLSGTTHSVFTGVCVISGGERKVFCEETEVEFYPLTDEEIEGYIATGEPFDKAGAYGIQDKGALLVKRINGDYYNVMGLPAGRLYRVMRELGLI